ncbi:hypothetical protein [Mucilaginibacter dorajii]|uniref:Uncharacterized protein n=1 Tax=Mucilaginibacter dorajii TaxID=692994 RepID=A0ABP7PKF3_9SPHI|nr:hypothetical protein [Mucilaginibacter dorajii]MCS3733582.1 hypothetical protein [Mucilaginibacter dorajii]
MNTNKNRLLVNKSSQQRCFFALKAFALQNGQNLGWDYFALALLCPAAKTPYALPTHNPALFCPFSPEAVLLALLGRRNHYGDMKLNSVNPVILKIPVQTKTLLILIQTNAIGIGADTGQ